MKRSNEENAAIMAGLALSGESCNTCANNNGCGYCPWEPSPWEPASIWEQRPTISGVRLCQKHSNAWKYA